ncbi:hypothetical protein JOM56_011050 [Amanita muscaria]
MARLLLCVHLGESISRQHRTMFGNMLPVEYSDAKAIQCIHSLSIALDYSIDQANVYLDSDTHVKLEWFYFRPNDMCEGHFDYDGVGKNTTLEQDIHKFGLLFYQVLFNDNVSNIPAIHPSEPEIPDNVWQLIQWCCAENPKERPTIDQVVQEMESWISLGQFTSST